MGESYLIQENVIWYQITFKLAPVFVFNYKRDEYKDVTKFDKDFFLTRENLPQFDEPLYSRDDCESCAGIPLTITNIYKD